MMSEIWQDYRPPKQRDFRLHVDRVRNATQFEEERDTRARLLQSSPQLQDRELGKLLAAARPGKPADTGCCPVNGELYRIYIVSRTLKALGRTEPSWLVTVVDPDDGVTAADHEHRVHVGRPQVRVVQAGLHVELDALQVLGQHPGELGPG